MWRARFGRRSGPVVRQTTKCMTVYMPVLSHLRTYTPLLQHHRTELAATEKELYVTEELTCISPYSERQKFSYVYKTF
jgi:hypothetical protein